MCMNRWGTLAETIKHGNSGNEKYNIRTKEFIICTCQTGCREEMISEK